MNRTNADDFRTKLKAFMEAARTEPVRITRRSGEAFVLLNAETFEKMQVELANLRGLAEGMRDALKGRATVAGPATTAGAIERAKKIARAHKSRKKAAV